VFWLPLLGIAGTSLSFNFFAFTGAELAAGFITFAPFGTKVFPSFFFFFFSLGGGTPDAVLFATLLA